MRRPREGLLRPPLYPPQNISASVPMAAAAAYRFPAPTAGRSRRGSGPERSGGVGGNPTLDPTRPPNPPSSSVPQRLEPPPRGSSPSPRTRHVSKPLRLQRASAAPPRFLRLMRLCMMKKEARPSDSLPLHLMLTRGRSSSRHIVPMTLRI